RDAVGGCQRFQLFMRQEQVVVLSLAPGERLAMEYGPQPGAEALLGIVLELRQLAKQEGEDLLEMVFDVRGRDAQTLCPARQQRREQDDEPLPVRFAGLSAKPLQEGYGRFVHP